MQTLSWDDYRSILMISRAGGATGAAEGLGVNVSTAFRRLDKIESSIQTLIFARSRKGYVPTAAGKEIIHAAEIMEQAYFLANRRITGHDQKLTGELRITATETLSVCFLAKYIPRFQEKHPELTITVISDNRVLNLKEREADIGLRPLRPQEASLVGRSISNMRWGIYGNPKMAASLKAVKNLEELAGHSFIVWGNNLPAQLIEELLKRRIPNANIVVKSNSLLANAQMASASNQLALLPCMVGSTWPGLSPVLSPIDDPDANSELWVVMHEDMRHNARVRAFIDYIVKAAQCESKAFGGRKNHQPNTILN